MRFLCQVCIWSILALCSAGDLIAMNNHITTVEKLQNTIKTMEALLEKQQKRMLVGFDGMRRRVYTLEKIADKTRKEIQLNKDPVELCPELVAPPNGRILGGKRKTLGDLAFVVCDTGFELVGDEQRICNENKTWSGKKSKCLGREPNSYDLKDRSQAMEQRPDCVSVDGGTRACSCPRGFQLSRDQTVCSDVDECELQASVDGVANFWSTVCQYKCENRPGTYTCVCPTGYKTSVMNLCTDVNECIEGKHTCNDSTECINTKGGYECVSIVCPDQYVKTSERTCERMPCSHHDRQCRLRPHTITHHYMALASKVGVPAKIFRLSADSGVPGGSARFAVTAGHNSEYFITRRVDRHTGWLVLQQQPIGPKVLRVNFQAREHHRNGHVLAVHIAKVVVFVSEYTY